MNLMRRSPWRDQKTECSGGTSWSTIMNPNSCTFYYWSLFSKIRKACTRGFRQNRGETSFTGVASVATFLGFLQDNYGDQV
jgi:hypothetical protein